MKKTNAMTHLIFMSTSLTDKEKNEISSILDQLDNSVQDPNKPYHSLLQIDEECRELWPSWNGSFYTPNHKTVSFVKPDLSPKAASFTEINVNQQNQNSNLNQIHTDGKIEVEVTQQNPEAQQLANEVGIIKDDLTDLMKKISQTVHSPDQIPQLVDADPINPVDLNDLSSVEYSNINTSYGKLTKQQQLAIVIQVQRDIMAQKQANAELEKELQSLKQSYVKSQKKIVFLRNEIKKSTIVLQELKRQDDENKNNENQVIDTSQMF